MDTTVDIAPTIPKYLEIIYDENDDIPILSNPYEIPLTGPIEEHICDGNSVQNDHDITPTPLELSNLILDNLNNKERTFSSSSTVSESSICYPSYTMPSSTNDHLNQNVILTVALPNAKEDCSSNDNLLTDDIRQSTDLKHDKIRQFYSIAPTIDDLSNCDDGITSM